MIRARRAASATIATFLRYLVWFLSGSRRSQAPSRSARCDSVSGPSRRRRRLVCRLPFNGCCVYNSSMRRSAPAPPRPAQQPSAVLEESRSTASCPIFVCSASISAARSRRARREHPFQPIRRLSLPLAHLVRMHRVLRRHRPQRPLIPHSASRALNATVNRRLFTIAVAIQAPPKSTLTYCPQERYHRAEFPEPATGVGNYAGYSRPE